VKRFNIKKCYWAEHQKI